MSVRCVCNCACVCAPHCALCAEPGGLCAHHHRQDTAPSMGSRIPVTLPEPQCAASRVRPRPLLSVVADAGLFSRRSSCPQTPRHGATWPVFLLRCWLRPSMHTEAVLLSPAISHPHQKWGRTPVFLPFASVGAVTASPFSPSDRPGVMLHCGSNLRFPSGQRG